MIMLQNYFIKKSYTDIINKRSSHSVIATRSGGIASIISIFVISSVNYLTGNVIYDFSILIPLAILSIVGLYDDIYNVEFKMKFIFQIIAAKIIIDSGFLIDNIHGVFGIFELNRVIAQILTIFIIVAIINSINFIDGIDGLAISIVLIFIGLFEFFSNSPSPFVNFTIILASSLIPLFYFNFRKKKKIFLGDSGSLLLGGVCSIYIVHILTNNYVIKDEFDLHKILFVISIFVYPIIDIIRIVSVRLYNGKSPFEADKKHLHHFVLEKVKTHKKTTLILVSISLSIVIIFQLINYLNKIY